MDAFPFDSEITGYDSAGIPQYDRASNAEEFARLIASSYYRVVVIKVPLQGLCYTVRDAVDWYLLPTTEMVTERLQPQPFASMLIS